jgi:hypothetical protein
LVGLGLILVNRDLFGTVFSGVLDGGKQGSSPEIPSGRGHNPGEETFDMRGTLLAMIVAAGVGLALPTAGAAAPISGAAIGNAAEGLGQVEQVQHRRYGSRGGHWRWGSRGGHWRYGSRGMRRCHRIYSSRWVRCW